MVEPDVAVVDSVLDGGGDVGASVDDDPSVGPTTVVTPDVDVEGSAAVVVEPREVDGPTVIVSSSEQAAAPKATAARIIQTPAVRFGQLAPDGSMCLFCLGVNCTTSSVVGQARSRPTPVR